MDLVYISGLEIKTVIGIFDWEREIKQRVIINLEMSSDVSRAATSDDIADALDYKAVSDSLIAFVEGSEFQLLETMAERITEIVRSEFNVGWLRLKLSKPDALEGGTDVGIIIERGTKEAEASF